AAHHFSRFTPDMPFSLPSVRPPAFSSVPRERHPALFPKAVATSPPAPPGIYGLFGKGGKVSGRYLAQGKSISRGAPRADHPRCLLGDLPFGDRKGSRWNAGTLAWGRPMPGLADRRTGRPG